MGYLAAIAKQPKRKQPPKTGKLTPVLPLETLKLPVEPNPEPDLNQPLEPDLLPDLLTPEELEAYEERIAIMVYLGKLPEPVAQREALGCVIRKRNP